MTTPGGVPNLPVGALTIDTLQSKTQDTSVAANRTRSGERVPGIFNASNGGSPLNDLTPFGVLTQLFSGFNSVVSQADPADINGPDDLPSLLMQFIEELPVVGQFVDLLAAFSGTYDGDDQTLLTIQHIVSLFIGADSPLNAANLYGQFGIPITWLNNNAAQALWNPGFDGPESIVGNKFQWDGTVYRTLSADHQPGSVRITADGAVHALRSNPYDLKAGDKLDDISVRVAWYGLSGTAGAKPLQISLLVLDDTGTQYVDIASAGMSDGVAASGWTGLPGGALGATLTGDWTATTDCTVVLRLVLDETASAGDIWWDAASMPVMGNGIPTEWLNALVADFGKMQAPFKTIDTFFDNTQWAIAWEGLLDILGLEQVENQIIVNRNSIWTKLFQQVIPPSTLNLHPDMAAVNDELAIIFNPFDNNDLDRAQAWDDLMGLVGIESHTADSVAWWNNLFAANKTALENQSGVTALSDSTRRSLNWVLGQLGFGYVNTSGVWGPGSPGAGDLPTGSGWSNTGGAPQSWLADILKAFGVPVGNDLPSQLDPTIPAAPVLGWPVGGGSTTSTSVPQNTNLYYIATVVDTATLKESAPSNEVMIWSMPAIFGSKNQVTISWFTAPPAGKTISLYRRQSTTGQYRRVASGRTGTSYTDTDPTTTVTTQPGSAAATAATVINGQFTVVTDNHQGLVDAVTTGADGIEAAGATTQDAKSAVDSLRSSVVGLGAAVDSLTSEQHRRGIQFIASADQSVSTGWGPSWQTSGTTTALGHDRDFFVWIPAISASADRSAAAVYIGGKTAGVVATDTQVAAAILGTAIGPDGGANVAGIEIRARVKSGGTDYVYLRITYGGAQLGCCVSGTRTTWQSQSVGFIRAGAAIELQCGSDANDWEFTVRKDGAEVFTYVDSAHVSKMGADYRLGGMAMYARRNGSSNEFAPPAVRQWRFQDVGAVNVAGVSLRMSRQSTTTVPFGSTTSAGKITSATTLVFDHTEWTSNDAVLYAGGIAFRRAGIWLLEFSLAFDAVYPGLFCPAVLRNSGAGPVIWMEGQSHKELDANGGMGAVTGSFILNVPESDLIMSPDDEEGAVYIPALDYNTTYSLNIKGEGLGAVTWFSVALLSG